MGEASDPVTVLLDNEQYVAIMFGLFSAFLFLFIISLRNKEFETYLFLVAPIIGVTISMLSIKYIKTAIYYISVFLDFPMSFIEICLYVQFINFVARLIRKNNAERGSKYMAIEFIITFPVLILSFFLIIAVFNSEKFNFGHGLTLGAIAFCFIYSIVTDNGTLIDVSLLLFKVALILVQVLANVDPMAIKITRITLVLISVISYNFKFDEQEYQPKVIEACIKVVDESCIPNLCISFTLATISYVFLSPNAFIKLHPRVSNLQIFTYPIVFIFYLINEVLYYHTFKTPSSLKSLQ
ncbi:hypothetical protein TVAG_154430 [Trichomonas vaginalis G3]|uniref:Uncharacterized protein n=1 Tax=Trichomonas vaginalis (strain ATCC PRA-98 / G3) TaxID=412133 RepID=A2E449_TRIV3|nr:hypothetical protein TVAGG3_0703210 [Trichomonas vaginalis G3]EAY12592.1 hypothetical protein TVAG_154430 [Trichomonas vaginalis G3]KAI5509380.1 hypothetical protein TVAGG3_0703210 [Trichomonas vaginalis G3]|eukprot:XP_001324815.1 hypothetical protein [Trichomonas vaginalis G3]